MKKIVIIILILAMSLPANAYSIITIEDCNAAKYKTSEIGISVVASRDIGPVTRMDGSGLIISVDIFTLEREKLPETLELSAASAILNQVDWDMNNSKDISISRYFDGTGFSFIFREGPLWSIDSSINIILTLRIDDFICEFSQQAVQIRKNY